MPTQITDRDAIKVINEMRVRFFVPLPITDLLLEIKNTSQVLPEKLRPSAEIFIEALIALHATTTLPFELAKSKANEIHFQRFHISERIRSIPVNDEEQLVPEHVRKSRALETAQTQFISFTESGEGINAITQDIAVTLLDAIKKRDTASAADELLFQAVVGLWSAFEVFVRDEFIALFNLHPKIANQLLNNTNSKKYFEFPKLSIDELSDAEYDLSSRIGTLIFGARDFSDIRTIRAAFSSISDDIDLIKTLNEDDLWHLNQQRHLIVHRRGFIDAKFKTDTKTQKQIGERIIVTPQDIEKYLHLVIRSGKAILEGVMKAAHKSN